MRIAVLDLGSTSFRLTLMDVDPEGRIVHRGKKRIPLNLGLVVGRKGKVPEPFIVAAAEGLAQFRSHAEGFGAERVIAVATSALRDASNREELTGRLELAVGGPIRFLDGAEEATLTFAALRAGLRLGEQMIFGLDLGGGSLELVVGEGSHLAWVTSLPLGAGRMTGMFARHDPMRRTERERLETHARESLVRVAPEVLGRQPEMWVAAGGAAKALARLITSGTGHPELPLHGLAITPGQIHRVRRRLEVMRRSDRLKLRGIGQHRVDAIPAGAAVLSLVADVMRARAMVVSEWGLREGIVLEACGLTATAILDRSDRALARS